MLTLRRLADLLPMLLVAIPLFGCDDAVTGDARGNRQSRSTSGAMPQQPAETDAGDMAAADDAAMNRIGRIEGRHFDLYRHYRSMAAGQMHGAADGTDDEAGDDGDDADRADGALRHAVMRFSATSLSNALSGCSMRALMALD